MVEFTRNKSLTHQFGRLLIDANHLYRIAFLIVDISKKLDLEANFEIVTLEREDTISTNDPNFFRSEYMPVSPLSIQFSVRSDPLSIMIIFDGSFRGKNTLSVHGNESDRVLGTFSELKSEIRLREARGEIIPTVGRSGIGAFIASLLCAAAVYSIFDIPLDFAYEKYPELRSSGIILTILSAGWILVFFTLMFGPILIDRIITELYPAVEFLGRLSRPKSWSKIAIRMVAILFLLPVLVNLVSGFFKDGIYLWFQ